MKIKYVRSNRTNELCLLNSLYLDEWIKEQVTNNTTAFYIEEIENEFPSAEEGIIYGG